jgi:effector-binding domain-containing protein
LGFSVEEISKFLEAEDCGNTSIIDKLVESRLRSTKIEIRRLQGVVSLLNSNSRIELMKKTMSEPSIKELPQIRVISKRDKGIIGETIGRLIGDLMDVIHMPENQSNFVRIVGPFMTIYHDHEYKEQDADIEVAIPITGKVTLTDPSFQVKNFQKKKVASLIHKGSYETIGMAYAKLHNYILENELDLSGPMMDVYLNDPNTVEPDEILTEIQAPVK